MRTQALIHLQRLLLQQFSVHWHFATYDPRRDTGFAALPPHWTPIVATSIKRLAEPMRERVVR
jgi:hypothetical protein